MQAPVAAPVRVTATPEALELIARLQAQHGPLMFHQSGGCCDGSAPMCYPAGEFRTAYPNTMLPESGFNKPINIFSITLLPTPEPPTMVSTSPRCISRLSPR